MLTNERKHQSSASLAFVKGIHQWPVNSPHKVPVTRKLFPFDDVNMFLKKWLHLKQPRPPVPRLNIKWVFPDMGISMLKIRRSRDRIVFNMGISILVRRHLYIEMALWSHHYTRLRLELRVSFFVSQKDHQEWYLLKRISHDIVLPHFRLLETVTNFRDM